MEEAKIIFTLDGIDLTMQCSIEDKMKDICQKYSTKVGINMNLLVFLYGGNQVNFELTFKDQASSLDKANNQMKILVYKNENNDFKCPKCGENIKLNSEIVDDIIISNNNIRDTINGIKFQLENIVKNSQINMMNIQLKNINIILNSLNEEIKKINQKLKNFLNDDINVNISNNNTTNNINNASINNNANNSINQINNSLILINNYDYFENKNFIEGILEIRFDELNENIFLFKSRINEGIDVFIDKQKIKMIKDGNKWKIGETFQKKGRFTFKIIFNNNLTNLERFFEENSNLFSIDLSNLDTSKVTCLYRMFHDCKRLKEIKGINKINTNKVETMCAMFQSCTELENLDLSNLDTSNVINMEYMFNKCNKLKEIKGIDKLNTNKVTNMYGMFQSCYALKYLDLSNFDTSNVLNMEYIFRDCKKLKEIKGTNS